MQLHLRSKGDRDCCMLSAGEFSVPGESIFSDTGLSSSSQALNSWAPRAGRSLNTVRTGPYQGIPGKAGGRQYPAYWNPQMEARAVPHLLEPLECFPKTTPVPQPELALPGAVRNYNPCLVFQASLLLTRSILGKSGDIKT